MEEETKDNRLDNSKLYQEIKTHCAPRCPRCQGTLQTMEVHGHEQCVLCHAVIEDCCQGAPQK
tara:strand:- start:1881 stop:2069 length:189 start_codon:yes stop_codon:yes gene_type:complete